jgi:hypothetical protein
MNLSSSSVIFDIGQRAGGAHGIVSPEYLRRANPIQGKGSSTEKPAQFRIRYDAGRCHKMRLTTLAIWCLRPFIPRGDGQSWDKVFEYPSILLLDFRRSGWQVQRGRRSTLALVDIILRLLIGRWSLELEARGLEVSPRETRRLSKSKSVVIDPARS